MTHRPIAVAVGRRLRAARVARGMSTYQASRRAGVSQASVSQYEHGSRGISLDRLAALAGVYKVTVASLVSDGPGREVAELEDILGSLTLYTRWRWLTKQLTTEQKERWAVAVERWHQRLYADDPETLASLLPVDRWWLCPTCGDSISNGPDDGPHERCAHARGAS